MRHCRKCGFSFIGKACPKCMYVVRECTKCGEGFRTHKLYMDSVCAKCRRGGDASTAVAEFLRKEFPKAPEGQP